MIRLEHVRREYPTLHGRVTVLSDINFEIRPGEKVGIIGKNGAGKSTMIRLISGAEQPDAGRVSRSMSVSWPLAFAGGFQGTLTGLDNLRFICRIYGRNWRDHLAFVDDFTELGRFLREPISTYSSGMRSRLAFALSMVVDFDCFLIDEVMAVGDHRFHERCHHELFEKRKDKAMIFVSHDPGFMRERCERASVLKDGILHNFDDLEHAFHYYFSEQLPTASTTTGNAPVDSETLPTQLDQLLFGREVPEANATFGTAFAEWLFAHPLNADPEVARHRLQTKAGHDGLALLAGAFTVPLPTDYSWRSIHSALAAYAEERADCPAARAFLQTFEADLPVEGPGGLWETMANEGGSIRRITTFEHAATGQTLPLRVNFIRAASDNHLRNELADFKVNSTGAVCGLQMCLPEHYAVRLFATFPYLLRYFEQSELSEEFSISLGDESLDERVAGFCGRTPGFLLPDPVFIATGGYNHARASYGAGKPWAEREDRAYWRGTDTGAFRYRDFRQAPRVVLALLAHARPDLIDARITQIELRPGWETKHAFYVENDLMGSNDPQDRILDFKYQIDVDGNTNSWPGLFLKLMTGAPVLKLESELAFQQWYYDQLVPWQNFVPVSYDGSDLVEKIEWLKANPIEAAAIGQNGRELALSIGYDDAVAYAVSTLGKLSRINSRVFEHS